MGLFDAIGAGLGINKTGEAIDAQRAGAAESARVQKEMYEQSRADLTPWREAGVTALGGMQDADYMRDFTSSDFQKDPGYDFRMQEGLKALERSAAARGGLMGGAALKGINRYSQDYASNEYQNAYNRFNADRDRRFGRLSTLSGMGQNAASQTANNAMSYGQSMGNLYSSLGNAEGAAQMAAGNSNAQLMSQMAQGAAFAFSDERLKKDVAPVSDSDLAEMKRHLRAYRFKYKDAKHGVGEHIGVMAQDLEKSKLGRTLVVEDAEGNKQIDLGRTMMLFLATMAEA